MPSKLLQQAMQPEVANAAWRKLSKQHTPWDITHTRDAFQPNMLCHLLSCRAQVLNGSYRPQSVRQFTLPKKDGRKRVLSAQYLRDKWVQRTLLTVLEPRAEKVFHDDSFAYRPGRGVTMALDKTRERICVGLDWLVDADIRGFFDNIPHSQLKVIL